MRDLEDIKLEVIARMDMRAVAEAAGLQVRRGGSAGGWVTICPFHADKSPSFVLGGRKGMEHRGHCFGCGWDGDVFAFWQELHGTDFKTALMELASLAAVPLGDGVRWVKVDRAARPPEKRPEFSEAAAEKPSLPPLRALRHEECVQLAQARGLMPEAVWLAARRFKRAGACDWPLHEGHGGHWLPRSVGTWPSWVVTDSTRNVAEFRRLDNGRYPRQDGGEIKAWSTRGKNWPVGAAEIGGRHGVALVEGGPDMLAAYQFLMQHGMLDRVAVVAMLGAGNRIREEALPFFKGKRVRIFVDADEPKPDAEMGKRKLPGLDAAKRWTGQLTEAGAAVMLFMVGDILRPEHVSEWIAGKRDVADIEVLVPGYVRADGEKVKDVNDLARCGPEVLDLPEVRRAWRQWDF